MEGPKKTQLYKCPSCDDVYSDRADAIECCVDVHDLSPVDTAFECCACTSKFDDEEAAKACCQRDVEVAAVCPECGTRFWGTDEEIVRDAQECCNETIEIEVFACPECGERYLDATDANKCCRDPKRIPGFACSECECGYETLKEAKECCG